jgi:hypothetical protein
MLYWIQCELFPYRYGSAGILNQGLRAALHGLEDVKSAIWRATPLPEPKASVRDDAHP